MADTPQEPKVLGTIGVMAGIPWLPTAFVLSVLRMQQYNAEHIATEGSMIEWDFAGGSEHASARNGFAKDYRGEWLLMLDTDHVFAPDLLHRLLNTMYHAGPDAEPLPVVCAAYTYHQLCNGEWRPKPFLVAGKWADNDTGERTQIDYVALLRDGQLEPGHVFQVDWAGGCGMLIHHSVLDRVREECAENEEPFDQVMTDSCRLGEDLSFCWRLRKLGIPIWLNPHIEVPHLDVQPRMLREFIDPSTRQPTGFYNTAYRAWEEREHPEMVEQQAATREIA